MVAAEYLSRSKRLKWIRQFSPPRTGSIFKLRINLLAIIGALVGVASVFLGWLRSDEILAIRSNSGTTLTFPSPVIPDLDLIGLCDTGWVLSHNLGFTLAAVLFFAGTILAFYNSLGGIAQVAGYVMFYRTFNLAQAASVSDLPSALPSGIGPKLALVSILLVMASTVFPVYVWSKVKLKSIWRRFLTVAPEKNVKYGIPLIFAAAGSAVLLWGQIVGTSSEYQGEAGASSILLTIAGLILLATAMLAFILPWRFE